MDFGGGPPLPSVMGMDPEMLEMQRMMGMNPDLMRMAEMMPVSRATMLPNTCSEKLRYLLAASKPLSMSVAPILYQ